MSGVSPVDAILSNEAALGSRTIKVVEIFGPTIQGEGRHVGVPTVFVRTGGCDFRCTWCDSLYAVLPRYKHEWTAMQADQILDRVDTLAGAPILITVSGGNPALQPLQEFIERAHVRGHRVALETQGSMVKGWMNDLDHLCISPKPPSSGMLCDLHILADVLQVAPRDVLIKVVVFDDADFVFARAIRDRFPLTPFALSVGNSDPTMVATGDELAPHLLARARWLVERCVAERWYNVSILPQLHVLLWGNARGV